MSLLRLNLSVELLSENNTEIISDQIEFIEFIIRNTKVSTPWPPLSYESSFYNSNLNLNSSSSDVTLEKISTLEHLLGPSLLFYAPLGGQISKEFRIILRHGLIRIFTQLVIQQICKIITDKEIYLDKHNNNNNNISPYIYIEKGPHNTEIARIHWSPELLQSLIYILQNSNSDASQFKAILPTSVTLILFLKDLKSSFMSQTTTINTSVNKLHAHKYSHILCTIKNIKLFKQSLHDERIANRLTLLLYHSYIKPSEQMREAGGESLQTPFLNIIEAFDCYQRALKLAQKGLLYSYRHALRPPQSLEDRIEDLTSNNFNNNNNSTNTNGDDDDDIYDENNAIIKNIMSIIYDITPANQTLNILLHLKKEINKENDTWYYNNNNNNNNSDIVEINNLYNDFLLAPARVLFPDAHPLRHVWYILHRQVIVAVANTAQTLLMISTKTNNIIKQKEEEVFNNLINIESLKKEMPLRVTRWSERALQMLNCLHTWCSNIITDKVKDETEIEKEWIWINTMKFKLLLRRAKLLRIARALDDCHKALEEMEEQIRIIFSHPPQLGRNEILTMLKDVSNQVIREKSILHEERNEKGGLVLRL